MVTAYRIELSPNARAVCKNTVCKDSKVKIAKGECRFATFVEIKDHQSWQYKHWGCVTPLVLKNVNELIEGDLQFLDGYEDLPKEWQVKVERALKQGHVDDEDWKWDVEKNRPGQKGCLLVRRKKVNADAEGADQPASPTKPASKKRKTKQEAEDDSDIEAAPPKKKRGAAKKEADDGSEPEAAPPKKKRGPVKKDADEKLEPEVAPPKKKRAAVKKEADEEPEPNVAPPKKKRGAIKKEADQTPEPEAPAPKKKRGAVKKELNGDEELAALSAAPKASGRTKKEVKNEPVEDSEGEPEMPAMETKSKNATKGKSAKSAEDGVSATEKLKAKGKASKKDGQPASDAQDSEAMVQEGDVAGKAGQGMKAKPKRKTSSKKK